MRVEVEPESNGNRVVPVPGVGIIDLDLVRQVASMGLETKRLQYVWVAEVDVGHRTLVVGIYLNDLRVMSVLHMH